MVTGDDGQIFVSLNAVDWSDHSIPGTSHDLGRVVYAQGSFLTFASGRDVAYRSRDGVHWRSARIYGPSEVYNVRYLHGRFVAPGPNGTVLFSAGGLRWKAHSTTTMENLECVAYGNRIYVAGGGSVIVSSRNGIRWQVTSVPMLVRTIEFVDGWFVAMGWPSGVLVSRDALVWQPLDVRGAVTGVTSLAVGNGILVGGAGVSLYRGTLHLPPVSAY